MENPDIWKAIHRDKPLNDTENWHEKSRNQRFKETTVKNVSGIYCYFKRSSFMFVLWSIRITSIFKRNSLQVFIMCLHTNPQTLSTTILFLKFAPSPLKYDLCTSNINLWRKIFLTRYFIRKCLYNEKLS